MIITEEDINKNVIDEITLAMITHIATELMRQVDKNISVHVSRLIKIIIERIVKFMKDNPDKRPVFHFHVGQRKAEVAKKEMITRTIRINEPLKAVVVSNIYELLNDVEDEKRSSEKVEQDKVKEKRKEKMKKELEEYNRRVKNLKDAQDICKSSKDIATEEARKELDRQMRKAAKERRRILSNKRTSLIKLIDENKFPDTEDELIFDIVESNEHDDNETIRILRSNIKSMEEIIISERKKNVDMNANYKYKQGFHFLKDWLKSRDELNRNEMIIFKRVIDSHVQSIDDMVPEKSVRFYVSKDTQTNPDIKEIGVQCDIIKVSMRNN